MLPGAVPGRVMAPAASKRHLLSVVRRTWADMSPGLDAATQDAEAIAALDAAAVSSEELKEVKEEMKRAVTKFGATAAIAEGAEKEALKPAAEEVIRAVTAALETLLAMRKGAGPSLLAELCSIGGSLTDAVDELGATVAKAKPSTVAPAAGKVLDRIQHFARLSTNNGAAVRRRLLKNLSLLRDAQKEAQAMLDKNVENDDDADSDDYDPEALDPDERQVMEAIVATVSAFEDVLKAASKACAPQRSEECTAQDDVPAVSLASRLEAAAVQAEAASHAVDGMVAYCAGGLEIDKFGPALQEGRAAAAGLAGFSEEATHQLSRRLDELETVFNAVEVTA